MVREDEILVMLSEVVPKLEGYTLQQKKKLRELFELEHVHAKEIFLRQDTANTFAYVIYKG